MVHALEKIWQCLKPGGLLIDIHPTAELASITVRVNQRDNIAGWILESDDYEEYEWADAALARAMNRHLFEIEQHSTFEFVWHADNLAELRAYLKAEWRDAIIDDVTAMRIEDLLKSPEREKEIIVRERINITRFRRSARFPN